MTIKRLILVCALTALAACTSGGLNRSAGGVYAPGVAGEGDIDGLIVGHRLMAAGEYQLALDAYTRAAGQQGLNVDTLSALGSANLRLGRLGQAERLLRRAVAEDAGFAAAWNNLGVILMEQGNGFTAEGRDRTAHAEKLLATRAGKTYSLTVLAGATLYSSAEPCAMCAGAIYWAGIGRVVFGQTEVALKAITGDNPENPTLDLPCAVVFEAGQRPTEVVGPLLEDEASALQADYWGSRG